MTTTDLQQLYRDQVLAHAKSPHGFFRMDSPTASAVGDNPLCGDKLEVYIRLDESALQDLSFEGSGCAISVASASMMTDMLAGQSETTASELIEQVNQMLYSDADAPVDPALSKTPVAALAAVRQYPSRVKCASLAWRAVSAALADQSSTTTE